MSVAGWILTSHQSAHKWELSYKRVAVLSSILQILTSFFLQGWCMDTRGCCCCWASSWPMKQSLSPRKRSMTIGPWGWPFTTSLWVPKKWTIASKTLPLLSALCSSSALVAASPSSMDHHTLMALSPVLSFSGFFRFKRFLTWFEGLRMECEQIVKVFQAECLWFWAPNIPEMIRAGQLYRSETSWMLTWTVSDWWRLLWS